MAEVGVRDGRDFLSAAVDPAIRWNLDGSCELMPANILGNHAFTAFEDSGEPEGYAIREGLAEKIVAHHINVSRPGKPRRRDMHRQTTAPVDVEDDAWEMQQAWIGGMPAGSGCRADKRKPEPPRLEAVPVSSRGFAAGTYGYAWGLEDEQGGLTTFTAFRYFSLATNQRPAIPVPESFPVGTAKWVLAMTRKNGGEETARIQRRVPVANLRGREELPLRGPWRNLGSVPGRNRSGFGVPKAPRRGRDVGIRPRRGFDLRVGTYRLFVQLKNDRGPGLLSKASRPIVVEGSTESEHVHRFVSVAKPLSPATEGQTPGPNEKEVNHDGNRYIILSTSSLYVSPGWAKPPNEPFETPQGQKVDLFDGYVFIVDDDETVVRPEGRVKARRTVERTLGVRRDAGIRCGPPRAAVRGDAQYTYWVQYERGAGAPEWFRAYPRGSRRGTGGYFGSFASEENRDGIFIHGYEPDREPKGLSVGLVSEDPPSEDLSVLEAPDPTAVPDEPIVAGTETPPAGRYLVSVTGVTESGALTRDSEPAEITLAPGETIGVDPRWPGRANLLRTPQWERLDAGEKPIGWTFANTGPTETGYYTTRGGVLTIGTTQATATTTHAESAPVPASSDSVFTIGATVAVQGRISGEGRVVLVQRDSSGVVLRTTTARAFAANGEIPFSERFSGVDLAVGRDLHPDTATVAARLSVNAGADPSVNLTMKVKHLRLIGEGTDIRYRQFAPEGSPDAFDVPADWPLIGGSWVAYGPPPTVSGRIVEAAPPWEVVGFEGGAWPVEWTQNSSGGLANNEVSAAGAIHEAFGFYVRDNDNLKRHAYRTRVYTEKDGKSVALRFLVRIDQLPTSGFVVLGFVGPDSERKAVLRLYSGGTLRLLKHHPARDTYEEVPLVHGTKAGDVLDVEVVATGGLSANGILTAAFAKNGANREVVFEEGGFDYRNKALRAVGVGPAFASEAGARWTLSYDQIVVTASGDVLDREQPSAPAGYVPPHPDVPPASAWSAWAAKRVFAAAAEVVPSGAAQNGHRYAAQTPGRSGPNQPVFPLGAGATVRDNAGLVAVARSTAYAVGASVLKPSGTASDAEWYEVTSVTGTGTTAATAPAYPTTNGATVADGEVTLTTRKTVLWAEAGPSHRELDPDGEQVNQACILVERNTVARCPFLEEPQAVKPGASYTVGIYERHFLFGYLSGSTDESRLRVWLEGAPGEEVEPRLAATITVSGEGAWAEDGTSFSVPDVLTDEDPVYDRARFELVLRPGVYVLQEPLFHEGVLTTRAARDAERSYARAVGPADVEVVLPAIVPAGEGTISLGHAWSRFGIRRATDVEVEEDGTAYPAVTCERFYATSDDGLIFGPETTERGLVQPDASHLKLRARLTGDGRRTPYLPSGAMHLETWHPFAVVLRADGSHFPGAVLTSNALFYEEYPDHEMESVGGHHVTVETSGAIGRIRDIPLGVSTEEAAHELSEASIREPLIVCVPTAEGRVFGMAYTVRFREQARTEPGDVPPSVFAYAGTPYRRLYGTARIGEAEVLERAPMRAPISVRRAKGLS